MPPPDMTGGGLNTVFRLKNGTCCDPYQERTVLFISAVSSEAWGVVQLCGLCVTSISCFGCALLRLGLYFVLYDPLNYPKHFCLH